MKDLDEGKELDSIEIKLKISVIKPLHANWLMELYNHLTSPMGRQIYIKGWKVSGIHDAVIMTSAKLPSLDPFEDIDSLINQHSLSGPINAFKLKLSELYISDPVPDSDDSDIEFEVNDEVPVSLMMKMTSN